MPRLDRGWQWRTCEARYSLVIPSQSFCALPAGAWHPLPTHPGLFAWCPHRHLLQSLAPMDEELRRCLGSTEVGEEAVVAELDRLVQAYGVDAVREWRDSSNKHRHRVVHTVACNNWPNVLRHLVESHQFDINAQRDSDLGTPAHLAIWFKKDKALNALWDLGANMELANRYGETANEKWRAEREKYSNLIFLDLELTSGFYEFDVESEVLEAAIIVTNKDLEELDRGSWVVGSFSRESLDALGNFHQRTFRDPAPGGKFPPLAEADGEQCGNGLFSDILDSQLTKEQVEDQMLQLVWKHCPVGACPLVGYSVQCDREVLKREMPKFYRHLSHRIVDVSSFYTMAGHWAPEMLKKRECEESSGYNHRALTDSKDAIAAMAWIRQHLFLAGTGSAGTGSDARPG